MIEKDLFIGMPVYNRFQLLSALIPNWTKAGFFSGKYNFNIYDDNSSEFTKEELINLIKQYAGEDFFKGGGEDKKEFFHS